MTCPITGDALIEDRAGEPHWIRTDPEIHVSQELLDNADDRGLAFLAATYEIGEPCPEQPDTRHARLLTRSARTEASARS